jgi:putative methionine-R-sulfoxide reductase with GAF domain
MNKNISKICGSIIVHNVNNYVVRCKDYLYNWRKVYSNRLMEMKSTNVINMLKNVIQLLPERLFTPAFWLGIYVVRGD